MGEYANVPSGTGQENTIRLGVMDDLRYVRRSELEQWAALGFRTPKEGDREETRPLSDYLDDPATLYRFPWPWEDNQAIEHLQTRNMFATVLLAVPPQLMTEHRHMTKPVSGLGGTSINLFFPCPFTLKQGRYQAQVATVQGLSAHESGLCSAVPNTQITIWGERYDANGNGRTCFQCVFCERAQSYSPEHIIQIMELNRHRSEPYIEQILSRLRPMRVE
jgi:hypothetical protein